MGTMSFVGGAGIRPSPGTGPRPARVAIRRGQDGRNEVVLLNDVDVVIVTVIMVLCGILDNMCGL